MVSRFRGEAGRGASLFAGSSRDAMNGQPISGGGRVGGLSSHAASENGARNETSAQSPQAGKGEREQGVGWTQGSGMVMSASLGPSAVASRVT